MGGDVYEVGGEHSGFGLAILMPNAMNFIQ